MSEERALRHNTGKPPLYYLLTFPEAMRGVARVSAYGEAKYARFNYLKGAPASESISCLMRHLLAWYNGEDVDPESGLNHLDAVSWNALRLTDELTRRPELDDRPNRAASPTQDRDGEGDCDTCKHHELHAREIPCNHCAVIENGPVPQWTPRT
jgi:hypothetical protein